jgi:ABC-type transporter Mla maintaining outer membrane lipid asymmetry ATPase subunit MlaF
MVAAGVSATRMEASATAAGRADAVLEFRGVEFAGSAAEAAAWQGLSFTLCCGDCALVEVPPGVESAVLADTAQGLVRPWRGAVLFRGQDWAAIGPRAACGIRGRTGRVFAASGWVSNLDVDENILLRLAHHARQRERALRREMQELADRLGVAPIPLGRPARVPAPHLRELQWVRAFLGEPELLVLERPMAGVPSARLDVLAEEVDRAIGRGGAVLWITGAEETQPQAAARSYRYFRPRDAGWVEASRKEP